jgi:hypothetical protein
VELPGVPEREPKTRPDDVWPESGTAVRLACDELEDHAGCKHRVNAPARPRR